MDTRHTTSLVLATTGALLLWLAGALGRTAMARDMGTATRMGGLAALGTILTSTGAALAANA